MSTTKFALKTKVAAEAFFFDGNNADAVIAFYLKHSRPSSIVFTWDGPYVSVIDFPGLKLERNRWLLWNIEGEFFQYGSTAIIKDKFVEVQ